MVADKYPERPRSDNAAAQACVLAAVWCRSVGTSWTLELHKLRRGTALGPVVEWINSGLPISQPRNTTVVEFLMFTGADRRVDRAWTRP